ncbi:LacI family DNA-binding transcriptional regulator [Carnobacterium sp. ISL-102]|uniref:LacI family DNA-binding transcriptional regulator n=1 Tax=Carnobacterium sp. ISL-102 TaxID=2819142 RepID=UPI001BEB14EB|nr:LacI family DNA-binding transcriptional regulator [Carnobacterium sp. ISL-102]MBT2731031.1 LacI family DNA-binding transcriptional regulator [Carnobacterium sp. ISL-102]
MTTIKEVAKLAGVSVATVSRALNNSGYVSEAARKKVEAAVEELNFYPNEVARSLYQKKSKLIGLLLPDIANPFFPLIAKGVEDGVNQRGYSLLLGNVEDDLEKEKDYLKIFLQNNIAGVISAVQGDAKEIKKMPFVTLDRVESDRDLAVHSDDYTGGMLAAEVIADRDPKEIVIMVGPKDVPSSAMRLAGNEKVLQERHLDYQLFQTQSYKFELAEQTAQQFFETFPQADSVIASNDVYAIALMKEASKRGQRIPEEFQIIGYDDMPFSRMMYPGLSTIAQPAYEIGYKGAELLCDILEKGFVEDSRIQLPVKLKIRESVRKKDKDE